MQQLWTAATISVGALVLGAGTVAAGGPPKEPFYDDQGPWACEADGGLPADHCINANAEGGTTVIMVFEPDTRGPAEGFTTHPGADDRPCPHDVDVDGDGTWWAPFDGVYVCHHKPPTPPGRSD